jgi:putative sigma-54 modulation protein
MKIIIQSPDFKAQSALEEFVNEKVGKLEYFSDKIIESRVCLKLDKSENKENKICEIKLLVPGGELFASRKNSSFEEAVMKSVEALKSQIFRWKDSRSRVTSDSHVAPVAES